MRLNVLVRSNIVVLGFDVFGEEISNPASRIAELFNGLVIGDYLIHGLTIPVSYSSVKRSIKLMFELYNPTIVIALGLSASKPLPALERIALNYVDSSLPDIDGVVFSGKRIVPNGPLALETNVDIYSLRDYLLDEGIPIIISYHAGTYLCNYVYYLLLYESKIKSIKSLFIHIPRGRNDVLQLIRSHKRFSWFIDEKLMIRLVELTIKYLIEKEVNR